MKEYMGIKHWERKALDAYLNGRSISVNGEVVNEDRRTRKDICQLLGINMKQFRKRSKLGSYLNGRSVC